MGSEWAWRLLPGRPTLRRESACQPDSFTKTVLLPRQGMSVESMSVDAKKDASFQVHPVEEVERALDLGKL